MMFTNRNKLNNSSSSSNNSHKRQSTSGTATTNRTNHQHQHPRPTKSSPRQQKRQSLQDNDVVAAIMNSYTSQDSNKYNNDGSVTSSVTSKSSSSTSSSSKNNNKVIASSPSSRSEIGRLADAFIMYVDVRNRRYKTKLYKNCFIGSEAVDALMYAGLAATRQDAVMLGRRLQIELRLFSHVKNDHDFKDDYLFFSFNSSHNMMKTAATPSATVSAATATIDGSASSSSSPGTVSSHHISELEEKAKTFYRLANVQDRSYRFKKYRLVFVGSEIVDLMVYHGLAATRWEAVQLGRAMAKHLNLFEHVEKKNTFADGFFYYKFTAGALRLISKMDDTEPTKPVGVITTLSTPSTIDISDHTSSTNDAEDDVANEEQNQTKTAIDLSVFKKKKMTTTKRARVNKKKFKYPDPLPSLSETSEDSSNSGNDMISPYVPPTSFAPKPFVPFPPSKEELLFKKVKAGLKYMYSEELLDDWQVVLAELRSEMKSLYTGHHKIIESYSSPPSEAGTPNDEAAPETPQRNVSLSDSITTINNVAKDDKKAVTTTAPVVMDMQKDLAKSFDAFESIVRRNATLADDTSVWTECIVEDEEDKHNSREVDAKPEADDVSYMEFTILEEEEEEVEEVTVAASYTEQTVVEDTKPMALEHSPKTVTKPPMVITQPPPSQDLGGKENEGFKTILVDASESEDDDMTAITMDYYFSKTPVGVPNSRQNTVERSSTCSQETGGTTKQQINAILRKQLWSGDEDVVIAALETLCAEVEPTNDRASQHNHRAFIVQCGGVMAILRMMELYPQNEAVHYFGCSILKYLAISEPQTKDTINDLDGIPAVVQSMQLHSNSVRVNEVARSALAVFL